MRGCSTRSITLNTELTVLATVTEAKHIEI
jgi:hypothetical protein